MWKLNSEDYESNVSISFSLIKQFWKLESGAHHGKLIKMKGVTISVFAPFTIGAPWLKSRSHLEERRKMESGSYKPSQTARANAKLAVTAGQMVMRAGEFATHWPGYRYMGMYQAIVRNSIPLFCTSRYYDETLHQIFQEYKSDCIDGDVVGRLIEIPQEFRDAFADFVYEEEVHTSVRKIKGRALYGILVGEDGTGIQNVRPTAYLDGDIWAATSKDKVTAFHSRFCNLADREDLGAAIEDLKREIRGDEIVYQFDMVEKHFEDDEEEEESEHGRRRTKREQEDVNPSTDATASHNSPDRDQWQEKVGMLGY